MLHTCSKPFKPIAWNGISLKVPVLWEIDSLDAAHMIIGEEGSPRAEIKWTEAPRYFTLEKYLKKFISRTRRQLRIRIRELPTPDTFSHSFSTLKFFFFSWEGKVSRGEGALIFCSLCKRLTMVRFFLNAHISGDALPAVVLSSFSDHPVSGQMDWQVFGLAFSSPKAFELSEYSFKPGSYFIRLVHKKIIFKVFSWGPGSFLLSETHLSEFAVDQLPELEGLPELKPCKQGNCLEWTYRHERFGNFFALPFFRRFSLFTVFRICHDRKANRILGVMVVSPGRYHRDLVKDSMIGDV